MNATTGVAGTASLSVDGEAVGSTPIYEIDVSHAHLDANGPWTELGHDERHTWDLDHVGMVTARYLRIRNISPTLSVYLDAVFARSLQPCSDPAACRDVNHLARR